MNNVIVRVLKKIGLSTINVAKKSTMTLQVSAITRDKMLYCVFDVKQIVKLK